jgi:hypothetical protein
MSEGRMQRVPYHHPAQTAAQAPPAPLQPNGLVARDPALRLILARLAGIVLILWELAASGLTLRRIDASLQEFTLRDIERELN